jgi:hypothetical protein
MKRRVFGLLAGLAILGLLPGSAMAAAVLDQSNGTGGSYTGGAKFSQTFTAGMSGALTAVDLYLGINGTETDSMSIQNVDGSWLPNGTILASTTASVTGSNISNPAWVEFAFTTPTYVTSGTQYAIVVTTANAQIYGTTGNAYGGGEAWAWITSKGLSYWVGFGTNLGDFSFKTFVDTAATAPSTAASASAFQSVQGQTAQAGRSPTPPPTSTASSGGADGGGSSLLLIAACLAAAAALVALRRNELARRYARENAQP